MKNQSNILGIILIVVVVVVSIIGYLIFKSNKEKSNNSEGTDANKTDVNTNKIGTDNDFYKSSPIVTPPTTNPPVVTPTKCGYLKYKREADAPPFKLLNDDELWKNGDSFVNRMRAEGHSDDYISYTAAFLKGMDLALHVGIARQYAKEILHFKSRAEITRNGNFRIEIQNQKYDVGTLICEQNLLIRLSTINRNIFK